METRTGQEPTQGMNAQIQDELLRRFLFFPIHVAALLGKDDDWNELSVCVSVSECVCVCVCCVCVCVCEQGAIFSSIDAYKVLPVLFVGDKGSVTTE